MHCRVCGFDGEFEEITVVSEINPSYSSCDVDDYGNCVGAEFIESLSSYTRTLLVCPECGDLQEGAVGCKIKFDLKTNTVTWYDFAWDFNDDEQDLSDEVRDKVQDLKSFTFDGEEYRALMKRILDSLNSDGFINL